MFEREHQCVSLTQRDRALEVNTLKSAGQYVHIQPYMSLTLYFELEYYIDNNGGGGIHNYSCYSYSFTSFITYVCLYFNSNFCGVCKN